jgi:hypothetical protein
MSKYFGTGTTLAMNFGQTFLTRILFPDARDWDARKKPVQGHTFTHSRLH